jgi:hypothetical protein
MRREIVVRSLDNFRRVQKEKGGADPNKIRPQYSEQSYISTKILHVLLHDEVCPLLLPRSHSSPSAFWTMPSPQ